MAASTFGQTVETSCLPPPKIKMMNENCLYTYSDTVAGVDDTPGSVENCCQACTYLVLKSSVPQSHETQWEVYIISTSVSTSTPASTNKTQQDKRTIYFLFFIIYPVGCFE